MSYIDFINRFWQCDVEVAFNPSDTRLFFYLVDTCNKLHWKQPFGHSDRHLALRLGMSVNTVRESKNRLKQRGLIDFISPEKRSKSYDGQTRYRIVSVSKINTDTDTVSDTVGDTDADTVPDTDTDTNKRLDKTRHIIPPIVPHETGDGSESGSIHDGCTTTTDAAMSEADASAVDTTRSGRKPFRRPTLEQVRQYCQERNNGIDPQEFIDFYTSKGWRVGKSPMKDWKACIRTWEASRKRNQQVKTTKQEIPL